MPGRGIRLGHIAMCGRQGHWSSDLLSTAASLPAAGMRRRSDRVTDAEFVEVMEHVAGVVVDAERTCALGFLATVAAGEEPDPERSGTTRGEHVPNAVAHHHRVADVDA